jgi:hypothetical protein
MKVFKTKTATRNAIYKLVTPLTAGFFTDNSWENVQKVWNVLAENGVVMTLTNAIYGQPNICKTWYFDAEVNGFTFKGYLVASFCGTVSDPTSRYDLCFVI